MRINARLDDRDSSYLSKIQKAKGFTSISDALKFSLRLAAKQIELEEKPGDKMRRFLASEYVGAFDGPANGSENYKSALVNDLCDKHDIV